MNSVIFTNEEKSRKEQARLEWALETEIRNAYERTFGSPDGRKVLKDIMSRAYMFETTFTGNSKGFLLEGKRSLGLEIVDKVPYIAMDVWREDVDRQRKNETAEWEEINDDNDR